MKIYHTETQAEYDALMVELERQGCKWSTGDKTTELTKNWERNSNKTCVSVDKKVVMYDKKSYYTRKHPEVPIQKYKAKAEDKMRFTKENVLNLTDKWIENKTVSFQELQNQIKELDDTPEKVVVPKYVADYLEDCKKRNIKLVSALCPFKMGYGKEIELWFDNEDNNRLFALAWSNGYEVEKEPLYYIPLPHLKTSDGIQQVLSKRKNGTNYFASRPNEKLKQRYTKEEVSQVPEIYKLYAKLIEEEDE